jgi:hypothetical protein
MSIGSRKDPAHPHDASFEPVNESQCDRKARKQQESFDEGLHDPVSPFLPTMAGVSGNRS